MKKSFNALKNCASLASMSVWTIALVLTSLQVFSQGTWHQVTSAPSNNDGVMLLLTDGSVIVKTKATGGGTGNGWDRLTPDIHGSYINGTWSHITGMAYTRLYCSAHVLRNGTVYVAGGEYGTGKSTSEIYYPGDDFWFQLSPFTNPTDTIYDANSAMLPDGRILQAVVITGSSLSKHTYLVDAINNVITPGPNTIGYDDETSWITLPDQSVLFADMHATTSERYFPATNTWAADATLPVNLYDAYGFETGPALLLPDGRVFCIGAPSVTAYYTPSGNTTPGTWAMGPAIPDSLGAPDAAAAMMVNGRILCALSHTPTPDSVFYNRMWFYEFDYTADTFIRIQAPDGSDSLEHPCYTTNMLALPDGSILYSRQGDNKYYTYVPSGVPLPAGKPTVNKVYTYLCDTFYATGTLFNGISEGAAYGDDWQMSTNYPIIRLSRNDTAWYASTYNWNYTGVMHNGPDTTQFVLPAGLEEGTYQLQVVANGFASDAYTFSFCHGTAAVNTANKKTRKINLFPNPANDIVTVEYTAANAGVYTVTLTDIYGRKVLEQQHTATAGTNTHTINLAGLAKGIYSVAIHDGDSVYVSTLVIK